ncbi:PAS domain-containing transcriptional regulator [Cocleimonas sp. KMM 6892]|uniref:PAS domain-containing transcriptional regulator n=1 Tax=unclassified Cocleimonas TaxID=2639732 RepID=UPI002DB5A28F|nr:MULTISPECIES: PAS domain-containing transcriptional regulator [unclassified Cocleimonas]MEB8432641.1 PAS domain-containing transcriptional regulator [Cocleimonas sp. KMM 6892]MEC4715500.1 PAS domain-containing transcriptional regulator [Cocleimonas sp. KMM 6895]MEC4744882.1 PAS domain-containing transcriptional regulator [Cocleimonas sp. KMM 6896]
METFQHKLQKFEPGIIWLDGKNKVLAMNDIATDILDIEGDDVLGKQILQFHPEKSRDKVSWLLESSRCPVESPPPMTMMINIPDKVLLIKVSKMTGAGDYTATCMVFYDLTDITTLPINDNKGANAELRLLFKLPIYSNKQVTLIDLDQVVYLKADGHYTDVSSIDNSYLCNLSLADLEGRLDTDCFIRIHRSYIVNIRYAKAFKKVNDQCMILLDDNDETEIPVSRGNVQMIKELLGLK